MAERRAALEGVAVARPPPAAQRAPGARWWTRVLLACQEAIFTPARYILLRGDPRKLRRVGGMLGSLLLTEILCATTSSSTDNP